MTPRQLKAFSVLGATVSLLAAATPALADHWEHRRHAHFYAARHHHVAPYPGVVLVRPPVLMPRPLVVAQPVGGYAYPPAPVYYAPPYYAPPPPPVAIGTLGGAIAGAAIGSTMGQGNGRTAAIAIGSAVGAVVGTTIR